jgi:hypothetical protein
LLVAVVAAVTIPMTRAAAAAVLVVIVNLLHKD